MSWLLTNSCAGFVKSPAAKQVFDFGCPVYYERAAALYEIPPGEYIPTLKEKKNPSLCDSDGMEGDGHGVVVLETLRRKRHRIPWSLVTRARLEVEF